MTAQRLRWALLGLLGAAVLAFIIIAFSGLSRLEQKSQHLADLKLKSDTAEQQLSGLRQAKQQIATYGYFKDVAATVIPNDKDQAQAVLDISRFANKAGFLIGSITFPNSTLGGTKSGSAASASAAGAADAKSASASSILSQAKPVPGIPGLYGIELTITPQAGTDVPPKRQVSYAKMIDFLQRIQRNRRTAQITQVTVQPQKDQNGSQYFNFSLTVNIFIKP